MTTYVPKGAGRAAHTAKTNKHAQRTPLPAKGATMGVTKKVSADVIKETVVEQKSKMLGAKSRGRKVTTKRQSDAGTESVTSLLGGLAAPPARKRTSKAASSTAPAAKEAPAPAKRTAAKRTATASGAAKKAETPKKAAPVASKATKGAAGTPTAKKAPAAKSGQPSPTPVPVPATGTKAEQFAAWALSVGWSAEHEKAGTGETVICEREPERVVIHFADNKLDLAMMPTHEYGARVVKLRNVSAAKKVMEMSEEDARKAQPEAGPRRERTARSRLETAEGEEGAAVLRKRLPWSSDDIPEDAEVLSLVVGRKLVWMNGIGGIYEEAHVLPTPVDKQRHLKIVIAPNGKRTLNFASVEGGFRSVYLENIWQVR